MSKTLRIECAKLDANVHVVKWTRELPGWKHIVVARCGQSCIVDERALAAMHITCPVCAELALEDITVLLGRLGIGTRRCPDLMTAIRAAYERRIYGDN